MTRLSYGFLASGALGEKCLQAVLGKINICFVLTDRLSDKVIETCIKASIPYWVGNPRNGSCAEFIKQFETDVLLSVNYLFLLDKNLIDYPKRYAINLHGSLLPKYRGRTPHVWAIINNEKETGITAHCISEGCDEGDIIFQQKISIPEEATGSYLLNQFFCQYPVIIDQLVTLIEEDKIVGKKQDETKATYFGKRTAEDGEINWNWQREQIRNWVRAQAKPYPGAFSYYMGKKIVVHKVEYSDLGFHQNDLNGKILKSDEEIIVKTPNGALKLIDIEKDVEINFLKGSIFHAGHKNS
jgi:methionyl-tRNA formyltransferase